ncbi:MAG: protein-glutamate O-methyltransferase CheR [bacterium]
MKKIEIEKIEIDMLLNAIFECYGYDFRNYARASLKRRLMHCMATMRLNHISELLPKVLYDPNYFDLMLRSLSITVTDMFRDPGFFAAVRENVIPILKTFPFIKIWHPGCATGEEVYSMAIILMEEGLYHRSQIYATDINIESLASAREGIYPLEHARQFSVNYQKSGGKQSFSDYYHAKYNFIKINDDLKKNITFAQHNLTTDSVFGEMNVVICRNVLIYFDNVLQNRVLKLIDNSLCRNGLLCLGTMESLGFTEIAKDYRPLHNKMKIYQKTSSEKNNVLKEAAPLCMVTQQ